MLLLGKDKSVIAERMSRLTAVGTRLDVSDGVNGCTLIYDTYTSDCRSLWQALDFMGRRATGDCTRTLILSDMPGDGDSESHSFERVAEMCRRANIDRFIGIGEQLMASAHLFGTNASFFASTDEFMRSMSTSDFSNELILIKGAPQFDFKRIQDNLEARKHETVLEVNLDSVVKNYNYFRQHLPTSTGLVAMVKASGYGAGSYEIAKTLQAQGAAYLAVAVLDEGIDLRKAGITMPIMVMNPKVVNYKSMFTFHLEPEIYSIAMLKDVIREAEKYGVENYPVHIKLDTGMHRMGFLESELEHVMEILNAQNHVVAASVFSHLATADCPDMDDYTLMQLQCFDRLTDYMQSRYPRKIKRHVLNSAGIIRFPQYHYDMARLGIGLYGANTLPPEIERPLAVVSTLRTVIIAIREWDEGESVGYARRGMLGRKSRIATIPIGYADGMNRRFGNGRSRVYINGQYAPTAGNICMDACMIDVTDVPCKEGDIVEIFGENVSVQELADVLETIPYEVLTSVSPRVKRVYFRE
jgi:alanine racemase